MESVIGVIYLCFIVFFILALKNKNAKAKARQRSQSSASSSDDFQRQMSRAAEEMKAKTSSVMGRASETGKAAQQGLTGTLASKAKKRSFEAEENLLFEKYDRWDPVAAEKRSMHRRDGRKPYDPDITGQVTGFFR